MRMLFIINTPGQAHTWKHIMRHLTAEGHELKIVARDYGSTPEILKTSGFGFTTFEPVGSRYSRLFGGLQHFQRCWHASKGFTPSIVVGFGIDAAVTAARLRRASIVFIDDDESKIQNKLTSLLASAIVTPDCFNGNLGRKHTRIRGYKELAYLHPDYFSPDITIRNALKIAPGEKYVVLRFNSWDAVHDIGVRGFSIRDKFTLVKELEKYARVFISPEAKVPEGLQRYILPVPYDRFHHVIYYSQMFVGDTGTTATEAAVLGTPSILCADVATTMGNFQDLNKRGLLCLYKDSRLAIEKAIQLIQQPELKETWASRREEMLTDRIDVVRFMVSLLNNYAADSKER